MAKFGPVKQPAAIVKLKGYYRPSRNGDELSVAGLQYLTEIPPHPECLTEDGQNHWDMIIGAAIQIEGYFAVTDILMFEQLCYTYQLMNEAQRNIKKYGMFRATGDKDIKATGFTKTYLELTKIYITLCREFGLSPSSRTSIKFQDSGEKREDLLADFAL